MDNKDKLWQLYSAKKTPEIKEKLILEYAHLVKYVAGRLAMHIGQHVEYDDLIGNGVFGLIDAIDKFDPEKGVKFETTIMNSFFLAAIRVKDKTLISPSESFIHLKPFQLSSTCHSAGSLL